MQYMLGLGYFKKYALDGKRVVSKLPHEVFQERLIHHFDTRFKRQKIKQPVRKKDKPNNNNQLYLF